MDMAHISMQTLWFSQQYCWRYMLMGRGVVTGWIFCNVLKGLQSFNILGTSCPTTHHHIPDHVHLKHTHIINTQAPQVHDAQYHCKVVTHNLTRMPTLTATLTHVSAVKLVILTLRLYQLIPRSCDISINVIISDMVIVHAVKRYQAEMQTPPSP